MGNVKSHSTIKPIGTTTGNIVLADGYVWKYLATVTPQDAESYLTNDYIPIEYKKINENTIFLFNDWFIIDREILNSKNSCCTILHNIAHYCTDTEFYAV